MTRTRAIVTGGAGDIGRATATALVARGFEVVLFDLLDDEAGAAAAARCGEHVTYRRVDCTDGDAVTRAVAETGLVDLAVLNAAVVHSQPFLEVEADLWRRQFDVNVTGAFLVAQAVARSMAEAGAPGHLIFMSSWVAAHPWPELSAYTSAKAALNQLARSIASELAPIGIRANAFAPGIVRAGLSQALLDTDPVYAARVASVIPLGELQTAAEIGEMVAALAGSAYRSMTGSVVVADGGCSLGPPTS